MNGQKIKLLYLLGAGRSGTTLLATVLNSHPKIQTIGEMHQFAEYLADDKTCSCGKKLDSCPFWGPIVGDLKSQEIDWGEIKKTQEYKEKHNQILKLWLNKKADHDYLKTQEAIFKSISKNQSKEVLLDSSKYIARFLLLRRSQNLNLKGIYVVRDVRGVINSFKKNVQTPKKPLPAIVYYCLINFFGELVYRGNKNILKIKYEDFIDQPERTVEKLYAHIFEKEKQREKLSREFKMPHIIGGNRMKKHKKINIKKDVAWKRKISRGRQITYYLLSAPFMLINRYKI